VRPAPSGLPASDKGHARVPIRWRIEEKYLLDEAAFLQLCWQLRPVLSTDPHARPLPGEPLSAYRIRSLYWDTEERHGLAEKLAGSDPRHKFRIRIYDGQDRIIHLEKKMRRGARTAKRITPLTREQVDRILSGDLDWLADRPGLGAELHLGHRTRRLVPRVLVDYLRIPLVFPPLGIRITFDRHLSSGLYRTDLFDPGAALFPILPPGATILEIKTDRILPDFLRRMLPLDGAIPLALSKYALCCRAIEPGRWADPQALWLDP